MTVNMDWLRQKVRSREAKPIWYDGLGDMERLEEYRAYSALLAFLEGYDPAERMPEAKPGLVVWAEWKPILWEPCAQVCETADDVAWISQYAARWYPLPGGGR
jgi:hypothetical protein